MTLLLKPSHTDGVWAAMLRRWSAHGGDESRIKDNPVTNAPSTSNLMCGGTAVFSQGLIGAGASHLPQFFTCL